MNEADEKQLTILLIGCTFFACLLVEASPDGSAVFAVNLPLHLVEGARTE